MSIPPNTIDASLPGAASPDIEVFVERLDAARLGRFHMRLLLVGGLCWAFTAMGMSIVGFLLPALGLEWGLTSSQKGLVASSGVMGMMFGAILAGSLADRIGRRSTLALAMLWIGVFAALSSLAGSYLALLGLRTMTGLGLGAALPVATTLVSEYSPARYRGRLLVLLDGFSTLGFALSGLCGYAVVGSFGWRTALLCTAAAAFCAPLVHFLLPESLRFLIGKGRIKGALHVIRHIVVHPDRRAAGLPHLPAIANRTGLRISPAAHTKRPVDRPWSRRFLGVTASLWLLWFSLNFSFQGVTVWLPSMLRTSGYAPAQSDLITLVVYLGQLPGSLAAVLLADRYNRRLILSVGLVLYGSTVFLLGISSAAAGVVLWGIMLNIFNSVVYGLGYPFTTEVYPTHMRGSATGWASGFGRIGGIIAPWMVGFLLQNGAGVSPIFSVLAAAPMLTALILLGVRRQTTGRTLEEISGG